MLLIITNISVPLNRAVCVRINVSLQLRLPSPQSEFFACHIMCVKVLITPSLQKTIQERSVSMKASQLCKSVFTSI